MVGRRLHQHWIPGLTNELLCMRLFCWACVPVKFTSWAESPVLELDHFKTELKGCPSRLAVKSLSSKKTIKFLKICLRCQIIASMLALFGGNSGSKSCAFFPCANLAKFPTSWVSIESLCASFPSVSAGFSLWCDLWSGSLLISGQLVGRYLEAVQGGTHLYPQYLGNQWGLHETL